VHERYRQTDDRQTDRRTDDDLSLKTLSIECDQFVAGHFGRACILSSEIIYH